MSEKQYYQHREALRLDLINWLEWNDRNGVYSDQDCIDEGLPCMTTKEALQCVMEQLED